MEEREQSFKNQLSTLVKEFPKESITFILVALLAISSVSYKFAEILNDNQTNNMEEEIQQLKETNRKQTTQLQKYEDMYGANNIIYSTKSSILENQSVNILNGEVTILVYSILSSEVTFEFSYAKSSTLTPEERWKSGSLTDRVFFVYEGKSYFVVIDEIGDKNVTFTVYGQ